ncbi:hypothetical protein [Streptomyces sp. JHA26]|uniref:hypothetical protein n=1 Tax=Streptomyces sp. JHA26 TaxID=1917143 RepID=UPI00098A0B73|nr:hypothetical protein [Streptomyces sp. JHA26]
MSESTPQTATELASQYSVQVTSDLERNVKEQERISGEIADLQQQLAALQHDHALLLNVQQALGITTAPPRPATDTAPVPAPRDSSATGTAAAGRRTASGKAATAPERAATRPATKPASKSTTKPASKSPAKAVSRSASKSSAKTGTKSAGKAAGKSAAKKSPSRTAPSPAAAPSGSSSTSSKPGRSTLVELVRKHLGEQKEPRSAAEITTALGQAHPDRTVKSTVVRTTLEGLVARNQAQRTKQGTSVYYTVPDAPEQGDAGTETRPDRADD